MRDINIKAVRDELCLPKREKYHELSQAPPLLLSSPSLLLLPHNCSSPLLLFDVRSC